MLAFEDDSRLVILRIGLLGLIGPGAATVCSISQSESLSYEEKLSLSLDLLDFMGRLNL